MRAETSERLERYRRTTAAIDAETATRALEMLGALGDRPLGETWTLPDALSAAGRGQSDLVLCLLRLGDAGAPRCRAWAEALTGRPIAVGLYVPPPPPAPVASRPRMGDDRRVTRAASQEFLRVMAAISSSIRRSETTSTRCERMLRARRGMSVRQLLARGLTRHDVLLARRRGWLVLEGDA